MNFVKVLSLIALAVIGSGVVTWLNIKRDLAVIEERQSPTFEETKQEVAVFVQEMQFLKELPIVSLEVEVTVRGEPDAQALVLALKGAGYDGRKTDLEAEGGLNYTIRTKVEYSVDSITGHLVKINQLAEPFVIGDGGRSWSISGE